MSLVLLALCLLFPCTSRVGHASYIIDGYPTYYKPLEWDYKACDDGNDVVPVQVDAIDIDWFGSDIGDFRTGEQAETEKGFVFLFTFDWADTASVGPEERSLEIFFDTVAEAGAPNTVWKDTPYYLYKYTGSIPIPAPDSAPYYRCKGDISGEYVPIAFAPDQRARVTCKEGKIVELAFEVWDGSAWKTQHVGPSIPEMEVRLGRWLEGAVRWAYITPQRYTEGDLDYTPFVYAFRTTQGEAHDYHPNPGSEWWHWDLGYTKNYMSAVWGVTWGWLKAKMR